MSQEHRHFAPSAEFAAQYDAAALPAMLDHARAAAALDLSALPQSQTHTDLFPDNVLMLGDSVTGLIDFYFACTGPMVLDLAVTHAAWCFDRDNRYLPALGAALVEGYESVRPLESAERALFAPRPQLSAGRSGSLAQMAACRLRKL